MLTHPPSNPSSNESDHGKVEEVCRDADPHGGQAEKHTHGGISAGHRREPQVARARRVRASQPRPGPAARLAGKGRPRLERPCRPRTAFVHPRKGSPKSSDRRPAPTNAKRSDRTPG